MWSYLCWIGRGYCHWHLVLLQFHNDVLPTLPHVHKSSVGAQNNHKHLRHHLGLCPSSTGILTQTRDRESQGIILQRLCLLCSAQPWAKLLCSSTFLQTGSSKHLIPKCSCLQQHCPSCQQGKPQPFYKPLWTLSLVRWKHSRMPISSCSWLLQTSRILLALFNTLKMIPSIYLFNILKIILPVFKLWKLWKRPKLNDNNKLNV